MVAYQQAKSNQSCCITCETLVRQNVLEAKIFINDPDFFTKMGRSLIETQQIPLYGARIDGSIVSKKMFVIDWPRAEIDIFGTIKEIKMDEFYKPYEQIYGEFNKLKKIKKRFFEESLLFINNSLSQCIKLFNSTI